MSEDATVNDEPTARISDSFASQGLLSSLGAALHRIAPGEVRICLPMSSRVTQHTGISMPGLRAPSPIIEGFGITQNKLAVSIGVPPRRINEIVHGKRGITTDTALRLAKYFGTSAEFWINLQSRYELDRAEDIAGEKISSITPLKIA